MRTLTLSRPDDWHLHLRDGPALAAVIGHTARRFARAIVMPNLDPPITTVAQACAYRGRILEALHGCGVSTSFAPLMTLYLTDQTRPEEIEAACASGVVHALKLYPAGATTHAERGVTDIAHCFDVLEAMAEQGLPLLVHGEVTDTEVDVFDREAVFLDRVLAPLLTRFPKLRVVLEHVTTEQGVDFVRAAGPGVAATLTAHHLLLNRNALFQGGIRPHHYCLPVLKRERHRRALLEAATSGNPKFFLGTDSAPHARHAKEAACGCAGCYTAHAGIELYAEAFDAIGRLDRLEGFASHFGADFYRLPRNTESIRLVERATEVPPQFPYLADDPLVPLRAGGTVAWTLDA
ncbi:MAG TPA: dihydroorotase [Rhodocyclaceae bacterium]|nr:dihydroorotase [Rhodocyclaceae bacterium]